MDKPIVFAHRGAPTMRSEGNTIQAFKRALALGANGLESDIGLTADEVPVLAHVGLGIGRRPVIARTTRDTLPASIPSLHRLYDECGTTFELSLDMAQPRAVDAVVTTAERYGASQRLWLTYWRLPDLRAWRARWPEAHLVYPAMPVRRRAVLRLMDELASERIDVLNLHHRLCRPWMPVEAMRRGVQLFAWGVRTSTALDRMVQCGVHGLYCDNLDRLLPRLNTLTQGSGP